MSRFSRFKGRLKSSKPKRLVMGIHPIPTIVTLGNLICGFGAIVLAMRAHNPPPGLTSQNCLYYGALLIFAAMVFDMMDGQVARWTKSASRFGMEIDSLCDVVSFGVAPAVLVKAMIDLQLLTAESFPIADRYIWPMLAAYVCCAALRLARYNVESDTGHRDFFFGMPSPGAAGCAASLVLFILPGDRRGPLFPNQLDQLNAWRSSMFEPLLVALPFVMLLLGVLMVSRVHYPHIGDRFLKGRKSFFHIMAIGLAIALVVLHHDIVLALAFNGYMLLGVVNEIRFQLFPSQRPAEWISSRSESQAEEPAEATAGEKEPPAA